MTAEDRRERCCKCAGPVEDEVMCFPAPRLCIACMPTPTPLAGTCAPVAEDRREETSFPWEEDYESPFEEPVNCTSCGRAHELQDSRFEEGSDYGLCPRCWRRVTDEKCPHSGLGYPDCCYPTKAPRG